MCCGDGVCGFTAIYVQIAVTVQEIRSLKIPKLPPIAFIQGTSDTPPITTTKLDPLELEIITCILNAEDSSSIRLSPAFQMMKDRSNSVIVTNSNATPSDRLAHTTFTPQASQVPPGSAMAGTQITTTMYRNRLKEKAREFHITYEEVFAEAFIHEMGHPYLGTAGTNDNGLSPPTYWGGHPMGQFEKGAYKDVFQEDPPLFRKTVGGEGLDVDPGTAGPPGCLKTILDKAAHLDFHQGMAETFNAKTAYPSYSIIYTGPGA